MNNSKFAGAVTAVLCLVAAGTSAQAQSLVTTLTLGPDQIGLVRSAQGITTRITFPDPVVEIVCGDLYDSATGKGSFVVQRSGTNERPGNDVFLKPIVAHGMSNLFVTTGDTRKRTYNFDLKVVNADQAHRVVNVVDATPRSGQSDSAGAGGGEPRPADVDRPKTSTDPDRISKQIEDQARNKAAEIIRNAQQQADRKTAEADARIAEAERQSSLRADQEAEQRIVKALMLGIRELRILKPRAIAKKAIITLDSRVLIFDDKAYLRYTVQNTGAEDFSFSSIVIEVVTDKDAHPLTIEVNQSKPENKLAKDESLTGVIAFDSKQIGPKDKLTFYLRGEDNSEIARLIVIQP